MRSQPARTRWFSTLRNKSYWYNTTSNQVLCYGPPSCLAHEESLQPDVAYNAYDPHTNWYGPGYYLSIILGFVLLFIQSADLLLTVLPKSWFNGSPILRNIMTPASVKIETAAKKAASYKMSQMIGNAIAVHEDTKRLQSRSTEKICLDASSAKDDGSVQIFEASDISDERTQPLQVLRHFQLQEQETVATGGFVWSWRKILDGSIFEEQGVFLHGRVLACNFAQFAVLFFVAYFAAVVLARETRATYSPSEMANNVAMANLSIALTNEYYHSTSLQGAYGPFLACLGLRTNQTVINYYYNPLNLASSISQDGGFGSNSILQRCQVSGRLSTALIDAQQLNDEWQSSQSLSSDYNSFIVCDENVLNALNIYADVYSDPVNLVQHMLLYGGVGSWLTNRIFFSMCPVSAQLLNYFRKLQNVTAFVDLDQIEYESLLVCMGIEKDAIIYYPPSNELSNFLLSTYGGVEKFNADGRFAACNSSNELINFLYQEERVYNNTLDQRPIASFFSAVGVTRKVYKACSVVGLLASLFSAFFVWVVHIPSFISTVLKFRSGVIPSLNDREFLRYRRAPDVATVLFGSAFWGVLFTATAAGLVAAICVSLSPSSCFC